jgi:glyoxalase family protein
MMLEGIHHVAATTNDAGRARETYGGVLGLCVHDAAGGVDGIAFGDDGATPGSILAVTEDTGSPPGRAGDGMVYRLVWRTGTRGPEFWEARLRDAGWRVHASGGALLARDPEGLEHEMVADLSGEPPGGRRCADVPMDVALRGIAGVRAFTSRPGGAFLTEVLGFRPCGEGYQAAGRHRRAVFSYDPAPAEDGSPGSGTVRHVAWAVDGDALPGLRARLERAGVQLEDRDGSLAVSEPSGVRFVFVPLEPAG